MGRRTPLFELHQELGARIVDFGGWDMPVQYSSQIGEHHAVRRTAGVFDVSHMCPIDLKGTRVRPFLQLLLANDVTKLRVPGKALYSCMLNEAGGVLDDLIVYFLNESWFRLVVNAGTRDKDLAWIRSVGKQFDVEVTERTDLAILAVQGPEARAKTVALLSASAADAVMALAPFVGREIDGWFVARTGYTGEDGLEVMLPASGAVRAWRELNAAGVTSCGLGARDTLRLEAGMNLYGNDMDESTHPFESGLAWTVAMQPGERRFIGREALERVLASPSRQLVGLVLEDRGVLRSHQKVIVGDDPAANTANAGTPGSAGRADNAGHPGRAGGADKAGHPESADRADNAGHPESADRAASMPGTGVITSGTFSPTLERSIALARVPAGSVQQVRVDIRGKLLNARVVKPPFVRFGKPMI